MIHTFHLLLVLSFYLSVYLSLVCLFMYLLSFVDSLLGFLPRPSSFGQRDFEDGLHQGQMKKEEEAATLLHRRLLLLEDSNAVVCSPSSRDRNLHITRISKRKQTKKKRVTKRQGE